jgi:hypothetical protein
MSCGDTGESLMRGRLTPAAAPERGRCPGEPVAKLA